MIACKRIYDPPSADDGRRVLVDRLWPRGMTREAARLDDWLKGLAPSDDLRRWFGHDPARWEEFRSRYLQELQAHGALLDDLRTAGRNGTVTLLFATRDVEHNSAVVLQEILNLPQRH
jgi:uncharacterized protein YeaO (DUF488 family)